MLSLSCYLFLLLLTTARTHKSAEYTHRTSDVERLQKILVGHLDNAVNAAANETNVDDVELAKEKLLASFKGSFFSIFETLRKSTLISVDRRLHGRPNVCGRGELRTLPATDGFKFRGSTKCQQFNHAIRCLDQVLTPDGSNETLRIRRCCEGSSTEDILKLGCTENKKPIPSLNELANSRKSKKTNAPAKESTYILFKNTKEEPIDIPGVQHVYDWFHGSRLIDKKGGSYVISQNSDNVERVVTYLNCVPLDETGIIVKEGVVHTCKNKVKSAEITVGALLQRDYTKFYDLLPYNIRHKLRSNNGRFYTVFVLTESTIEKYSILAERVFKKKEEFAAAHVYAEMGCSYLFETTTFTSISDHETLLNKTQEGKFTIGEATVETTDIIASNGVIHEIDKFIDEEKYKLWNERLQDYDKDFVDGIVKEHGSEPLTVFMPPKGAQVDKRVLNNHVVKNSVEDFCFEKTVTTASNSKYFFGKFPHHEPLWNASTYGEEPFADLKWYQLGCTRINPKPLKAFNGYVYFVERPLPKIIEDLKSFLHNNKELSTFESLYADFSKGMKNPPVGFTLFIPTNKAFDVWDSKKLKKKEEMQNLVWDHMLLEPVCEHSLAEGQENEFRTFSEKKVHLKNKGGSVFVYGSQVEKRVELSDCIVFLVNSVLKHL